MMANEFAFTLELNEKVSRDKEDEIRRARMLEDIKSQRMDITIGMREQDEYKLGNPVPSRQARNILIVTHGRSGSSFIGEMLSQYPGIFYSYEPLHFERDTLSLENKIERIKQVFKCEPPESLIQEDWPKPLHSNFRFHNACEQYGIGSCKVPEVYKSACRIFPIHLIKTIRLPFEEANTILMDPEIGNKLKIIFLLRDPRGVHQSVESIVNWCNECSVSNLCKRLKSDVKAAFDLKKQYPGSRF